MKDRKKVIITTAALILASVCTASCKDINTTANVKEHSASQTASGDAKKSTYGGNEVTMDFNPYKTDEKPTGEGGQPADTGETVAVITAAPAVTTTAAAPATTTTTAASETTTTTAAPITTTTTTTTAEQTKPAPVTTSSGDIEYNHIGESGILVSYQNGHYRALSPCFGTYSACDKWADACNTFAAKLPGVRVYSLEAPLACEFYTPQKFWDSGNFTTLQKNKIDAIGEKLSGVTHVDAYSALKAHTSEDIYSRTDHHWMPLGAYYAAQVFAKDAGVDFPTIDKYKEVSLAGYVGSMYNYSKDAHLKSDPEVFTMYISPNDSNLTTTYYNTSFGGGKVSDLFVARNAGAFYCSFLGSDDRIAKVETDVTNGRTLVVFKQSYGNALIPFLTSGFQTIYVCDMRYFNLNAIQFCKDVGATDILCTDCVMTTAGNGGTYLTRIQNQ